MHRPCHLFALQLATTYTQTWPKSQHTRLAARCSGCHHWLAAFPAQAAAGVASQEEIRCHPAALWDYPLVCCCSLHLRGVHCWRSRPRLPLENSKRAPGSSDPETATRTSAAEEEAATRTSGSLGVKVCLDPTTTVAMTLKRSAEVTCTAHSAWCGAAAAAPPRHSCSRRAIRPEASAPGQASAT